MKLVDISDVQIALTGAAERTPALLGAGATVGPDDLRGYDIVTAITQDTLNFQMKALWQRNIVHRKLHRELDDIGVSIDAELEPPTVKLGVTDDPSIVLFTLRLGSGTMSYYEGFGPKAVRRDLTFTSWRFAFRVNLNLQAIEKDALAAGKAVPEEVKASLTRFSDDHFTIRHLFMDFQDANLAEFDASETDLRLPDGSPIGAGQLEQLRSTLLSWFHWVKGTGNPYILGYSVEAKATPGGPAPLFAPTATTFSTVKDETTPGNSCLLFLSMTGGAALPDPASARGFRGAFGVPKDADGSMVISAAKFTGQYVEPVLLSAVARALKPIEPFAPVGDVTAFKLGEGFAQKLTGVYQLVVDGLVVIVLNGLTYHEEEATTWNFMKLVQNLSYGVAGGITGGMKLVPTVAAEAKLPLMAGFALATGLGMAMETARLGMSYGSDEVYYTF